MSLEAININYGLKAITINIPIGPGTNRFILQQNNELGLPHNAIIVGLYCRDHENTIQSSINTGITLVDTTVFENAYLTLKDVNCDSGAINMLVSQYHMKELTTKALFLENVRSEYIDWNNSFIEINPRAAGAQAANTVIEIVVLYQDDCNEPIKNRFYFRNGLCLPGKRVKYFEVPLNANGGKYNLSNVPNIGLPNDAIIIGFSTKRNETPLRATDPQSEPSYKSTYLTLQKGTQMIIEDYPTELTNYQDALFSDLEYFPISPTEVAKFNWQSSHVRINDTTGLTNLQSFQLYLFWYRPTE